MAVNPNHQPTAPTPPRRRLRILLSAYACEPGLGSEPGVGWGIAKELARLHDVWVVTRADHRRGIEAELQRHPLPGAVFLYHKLPGETGKAWYRKPLLYFHYHLWQVSLYQTVRTLHRAVGLDIVHHVTYVRYWTPDCAAFLGVPFLFGPVGAGETAPPGFLQDFTWSGRVTEFIRSTARTIAGLDPLLRGMLRRSKTALATTRQTEAAIRHLGAPNVRICPDVAMDEDEIAALSADPAPEGPVRLMTVSRLIPWKGIHLGIRALAEARIADAEYWIIGVGPEQRRLERIARDLGIGNQVRFLGRLPRTEVLAMLKSCHALVHPSLRETGGNVCIEAMAAGRPVLCLDWGGPGTNVTAETGWKVFPHSPQQVVQDMAAIIRRMSADPAMVRKLGEAARHRVRTTYTWQTRVNYYCRLYEEMRPASH